MDLKLVLVLAATAIMVEAYPRYVAIPIARSYSASPRYVYEAQESHQRRPVLFEAQESRPRPVVYRPQESRQNPVVYQPVFVADGEVEQRDVDEASSDRYERQSGGYGGGNDHVDYGAYTGGYGAFGWYSDHPVCINCGYHR